MREREQTRWDLLLLLSLLVVILMYPALDHGDVRRLVLGVLMFVPLISATVRMSQIKAWIWPSVLAGFFGVTVVGLFNYLKNARSISGAHLYTAVSIYLLIGMQWFALYSAIDVVHPGS